MSPTNLSKILSLGSMLDFNVLRFMYLKNRLYATSVSLDNVHDTLFG